MFLIPTCGTIFFLHTQTQGKEGIGTRKSSAAAEVGSSKREEEGGQVQEEEADSFPELQSGEVFACTKQTHV